MNLSHAYQKLFAVSGYTFIFGEDGEIYEWDSDEMIERGFNRIDSSVRLHLVPGSFNPLHDSHKELYEFAYKNEIGGKFISRANIFFELSVERVDKGVLSLPDLGKRLEQFQGYAPVVVSRAPRFVQKIGLYLNHVRGVTFHVGIDCITRMKDDYSLWGIQGLAARFIVHDRIMNEKHMSLSSEFGKHIPRNCKPAALIRSPESLIRSSSQIRKELEKK